jgi:hypothetical protein
MAKIFIQPDADGDLHTAALHNDKFQSVLNEINGNIDETNLKYPNSILTLHSSAGLSSRGFLGGDAGYDTNARIPMGWVHVLAGQYVNGWSPTVNTVHILQDSFHKADRALKVEKAVVGIMESPGFTAGQHWTITVQTSTGFTAGSTWNTVATQGSIDLNATNQELLMFSLTPSSSVIPANNYVRVILTTPSGAWGEYEAGFGDGSRGVPPPFWCNLVCSTQHVE